MSCSVATSIRPVSPHRLTPALHATALALALVLSGRAHAAPASAAAKPAGYEFDDSHFHLTNYIQEGITPQQFLKIMGTRVGRSTLFGIPLQQQWSYRNSGDEAPTYYLDTDSPLYYYSFTDAAIAMAYRSLSKTDQARFDPTITGFDPADMYAADHIRRVLLTFPGVFEGIGEFTIHKEFVSSKVSGEVASLTDPALDRILDFAAEAGLVVILHNDVDRPFAKQGSRPKFLEQMKALVARHPATTIIWAHTGLGRVIQPVQDHVGMVESLIADPAFANLCFDISWDEVAKYAVSSPQAIDATVAMLNRHPERFLFGSDTVAPKDASAYFAVYDMWKPVFDRVDVAAL
ncbi:MAG TPA: amidohydrolase family protein, partial [Verrucomicrobiae bacterium]|nr:amidohydrolase family protein [Verrucomicrobiae bacterium]